MTVIATHVVIALTKAMCLGGTVRGIVGRLGGAWA